MNLFLKKANREKNLKDILGIILFCIGVFLWFTYVNEKKATDFYYDITYFDEQMMKEEIDYAVKNDFVQEDILLEQEKAKNLLKRFKSLSSSDQTFFLQFENRNQKLNQELTDVFENLSYIDYISGKTAINTYLINHHLSLKSLNYSTDSALFTMNILEFLNTPFFFLCFFLFMPITYFKKYEDGRFRFLFTQPIKRRKVLMIDYLLFLRDSLFVFFLILVSSFSLSYIVSNSITLDYPVLLTIFDTPKIIPIYQYLVVLCFTFFFVGSFIFLLIYTCLLLCKKSMLAIFLTMFICFSWNFLISYNPSQIAGFNPFSYLNIESLSKSVNKNNKLEYIMQNDRNIDLVEGEDLYVGNIVENPYYYANDSIVRKSKTASLICLPLILGCSSLCLFCCNILLLDHY